MLAALFKHPPEATAAWQLLRAEALAAMVRIGLEQLAKSTLRPELIPTFAKAIQQHADSIAGGKPWEAKAYEAAMVAALAV